MKKRTVALFSAAICLALLTSVVMNISTDAQRSPKLITQAEFIDLLLRAVGQEDGLLETATLAEKIQFLENLGYAPLDGWNPEAVLTWSDTDAILAQILPHDIPVQPTGDTNLPLSQADVNTSINDAAALPAVDMVAAAPFQIPVSIFMP